MTMAQLSTDRYFAAIESNSDLLADVVATSEPALPIPTCPDWTLRQLATHLGRTHRWVAEIATSRSAEYMSSRDVPDGRYPDDRSDQAPWLRAGARRVTDAVREAGSQLVWVFGESRPASFWARRMAHETLVHRIDGQLAVGQQPEIDPVLAADAIDEWLMLLTGPLYHHAGSVADSLPAGTVMHLHATDDGLTGAGEWLIRHGEDGLTVAAGHGKGDIAISGPAASLLLLLVRRLPATEPSVAIFGDDSLLTGWLATTPF
jgi:uncharacterized protein (TIGR03083 family)